MNEADGARKVPALPALANRSVVIEMIVDEGTPAAWLNAHPMGHLWKREAETDRWTPSPIGAGTGLADSSARLESAWTPDGECWVLLAGSAVRVNGDPLDVGIAVLRDRDEILAATDRVFFGTERLATLETYAAGERVVFCPRCKLQIAAGASVVRCPACRVLHHQSEELPCWTHAEHCAMCDQATAFEAGYRWTPETL